MTVVDNQKGRVRKVVEALFQKRRIPVRMTVQLFTEEETKLANKDTSEKGTVIEITYCVE